MVDCRERQFLIFSGSVDFGDPWCLFGEECCRNVVQGILPKEEKSILAKMSKY